MIKYVLIVLLFWTNIGLGQSINNELPSRRRGENLSSSYQRRTRPQGLSNMPRRGVTVRPRYSTNEATTNSGVEVGTFGPGGGGGDEPPGDTDGTDVPFDNFWLLTSLFIVSIFIKMGILNRFSIKPFIFFKKVN
ncbi:MAG: hypothetical protein ACOVNR_05600 [Chitinophagaceae bacterium]